MNRSFLLAWVLLLTAPATGYAQPYDVLRASYPDAYETTVRSPSAYLYSEPDLSAQVIGRFNQGKAVLAYDRRGDFYAVATPDRGHTGYMLLTDLDVPQDPGAAVAPRRSARYKDPAAAQTMGVALPGGGHLYAGETGKGAALFALSLGSFIGGYALTLNTRVIECGEFQLDCTETMDYSYLLGGSAVSLAGWVYGALDAPRSARRMNARNGLSASFYPAPAGRLGLAMRVRW